MPTVELMMNPLTGKRIYELEKEFKLNILEIHIILFAVQE